MRWALAELLDRLALCGNDLVDLRFFRTRRAATRKLSKMQERKEVGFFCRWRFEQGTKPDYYYTNAGLKLDHKEHEVLVAKVFVLLHEKATGFRCGPDVSQTTLPDLTITLLSAAGEEVDWDVELDRRSMSLGRMRQRFARYKDSENPLLVVTTGSDERMKNLMSVAQSVADFAYFTTFSRLRKGPFGKVLEGADGKDYALDVR